MCQFDLPKLKLPIHSIPIPSFPPKIPIFTVDVDIDLKLDLPRPKLPIPSIPKFILPFLILFLIDLAIRIKLALPRLKLPIPAIPIPAFPPKLPIFVMECPFD